MNTVISVTALKEQRLNEEDTQKSSPNYIQVKETVRDFRSRNLPPFHVLNWPVLGSPHPLILTGTSSSLGGLLHFS